MLHHQISIIGLTWPSTPTIAMRPTSLARAKSQTISGDFRCMVPLPWQRTLVLVSNHPSERHVYKVCCITGYQLLGANDHQHQLLPCGLAIQLKPNPNPYLVVSGVWCHYHDPSPMLWCCTIHLGPI